MPGFQPVLIGIQPVSKAFIICYKLPAPAHCNTNSFIVIYQRWLGMGAKFGWNILRLTPQTGLSPRSTKVIIKLLAVAKHKLWGQICDQMKLPSLRVLLLCHESEAKIFLTIDCLAWLCRMMQTMCMPGRTHIYSIVLNIYLNQHCVKGIYI